MSTLKGVDLMDPLHDLVTRYKIRYTGEQAAQYVGLFKQRQVQVNWYKLHSFGSPNTQLAHRYMFCTTDVTGSCKGPI